MTEKGYHKATSSNLPSLDMLMVASFLSTNEKFVGAELKGVKNSRAGRENYGDDAIGYVQVQRINDTCRVQARVTPEHKVRSKGYNVNVVIDEIKDVVLTADCQDCAASAGGCKHAIALLMWIHRRSEEPAPTSVACYWKKSKLSGVGSSLKFVRAVDLGTKKTTKRRHVMPSQADCEAFLGEALSHGRALNSGSQLHKHYANIQPHQHLALNHLSYLFLKSGGGNATDFLKFCDFHMTADHCQAAQVSTVDQCQSSVWHSLRFGRITASKIHEAARCQTVGGSLTEAVLGASFSDTAAMKRGRDLEPLVLKKVSTILGESFKSVGLLLSPETPAHGASPDSISKDCVIEVKCPANVNSVKNYVNNGQLAAKCLGQIQLQMHMAKKKEGLFCVAHPDFEASENVDIYRVKYDQIYIEKLIKDAMYFWESVIFPRLMGQV